MIFCVLAYLIVDAELVCTNGGLRARRPPWDVGRVL